MLGASTLGEILMDVCAALSRPIEGFFDDANQEDEFLGVKILGGMDALLSNARVREAGVFVAIGDNQKRRTVCEQLKTAGFSLPRVIHPSAWVAPSARLGSGNLVLAGACIGTRTRIGAFNLIFPGVCFSHHNEVGDFNFFAPNVSIGGYTRLASNCHIGMNSVIEPYIQVQSGFHCPPLTTVQGKAVYGPKRFSKDH